VKVVEVREIYSASKATDYLNDNAASPLLSSSPLKTAAATAELSFTQLVNKTPKQTH
jgi:hypothetical protein